MNIYNKNDIVNFIENWITYLYTYVKWIAHNIYISYTKLIEKQYYNSLWRILDLAFTEIEIVLI